MMTIEQTNRVTDLYVRHHNICPICKCTSDQTWGSVLDNTQVRECSCGAKWIPLKPTEEELNNFVEFAVESYGAVIV